MGGSPPPISSWSCWSWASSEGIGRGVWSAASSSSGDVGGVEEMSCSVTAPETEWIKTRT